MNIKAKKTAIVAALLAFVVQAPVFSQKLKKVSYGDFEQWIVRDIEESFLLGGNTRRIYDIGKTDTIKGNQVLRSTSIWGTANAFAKVAGVVKTSVSVTPEKGPTGYCVKLVNRLASCKVIGLVDVEVLAGGSIFWGRNIEPISNVRHPYKNMNWGVPFTQRPSALVVDYKANISKSARTVEFPHRHFLPSETASFRTSRNDVSFLRFRHAHIRRRLRGLGRSGMRLGPSHSFVGSNPAANIPRTRYLAALCECTPRAKRRSSRAQSVRDAVPTTTETYARKSRMAASEKRSTPETLE